MGRKDSGLDKAFRGAEREAAKAVAKESIGIISECCEDIRIGLADDSDDGDELIENARRRLLAHASTMKILHVPKQYQPLTRRERSERSTQDSKP